MSDMSSKNHKNESSEKIHPDKKARRRELYRMMQDDKKEALLARARERAISKGETSGRQLPACSLINSSVTASSSMSANTSSEQYLPFVGHSIYETG
ncbi:hypothetical protein A4A49_55900 [Nicotiana attenuata]|uniref:Uncharacterized protein n=1 Tax=Nicotiana attenuata TaxID=49451 RepID=A0A314LAR5_NICAT|nr:hypothetical protein A4A49_55900 [Nicotiana attenuata]